MRQEKDRKRLLGALQGAKETPPSQNERLTAVVANQARFWRLFLAPRIDEAMRTSAGSRSISIVEHNGCRSEEVHNMSLLQARYPQH